VSNLIALCVRQHKIGGWRRPDQTIHDTSLTIARSERHPNRKCAVSFKWLARVSKRFDSVAMAVRARARWRMDEQALNEQRIGAFGADTTL